MKTHVPLREPRSRTHTCPSRIANCACTGLMKTSSGKRISPSARPTMPSPLPSVNCCVGSPVSPRSASLGPLIVVRAAEKSAVPPAGVGGAAPARLAPHRGQNWSPARTGLPHESQVSCAAGSFGGSVLIRPPHCGQNGRPLLTCALQKGHALDPGAAFAPLAGFGADDTRVFGTPVLGVDR